MGRRLAIAATGLLCLAVAACGQKEGAAEQARAPAPPASTAVEPVEDATINEIMAMQAEPAADAIWDSVRTVSDATGVHEFRPKTDAEWAAVAQAARTLIGVSQLVGKEGRQVVRPGVKIEEGGTLEADGIQAKIAANRAVFLQKAKALEAAAREALTAAEARDADHLLNAGGPIDDACEACHTEFYYPPAGAP